MYRSSENAYAALDFTGLGYITKEVFCDNIVVRKRIPFTLEQMGLFFQDQNMFAKGTKGIDFDGFKKTFFPHHYLVQDPPDDFEDKEAHKVRMALKNNVGDQEKDAIEDRVKRLEVKLKQKFANCFESVRKAFLLLDSDYDGYISTEDLLRYFGNDSSLNYNELKKLLIDKDSKKQGRINYSDFSKWLGNAIHLQQGFYFRHDSKKNPQQDMFVEKDTANKASDKEEAARVLYDIEEKEIENRILLKIMQQWKTLRKAFMDINRGKNGKIAKDELWAYLKFWKIMVTDE